MELKEQYEKLLKRGKSGKENGSLENRNPSYSRINQNIYNINSGKGYLHEDL
jgi:hypothetical protein